MTFPIKLIFRMPVENVPLSALRNLGDSDNNFILAKLPRIVYEAIKSNDFQSLAKDKQNAINKSNLKNGRNIIDNSPILLPNKKNNISTINGNYSLNSNFSKFSQVDSSISKTVLSIQTSKLSNHSNILSNTNLSSANAPSNNSYNPSEFHNALHTGYSSEILNTKISPDANTANNQIFESNQYNGSFHPNHKELDKTSEDDLQKGQQVKTKRYKNKKNKAIEPDEKSGEKIIKGSWTQEEDDILRDLVLKYGPKRWSFIAEHLPHRVGKQCRERWLNHLDPSINKGEWSEQEDQIIVVMQDRMGNRWARISKCLRGRTPNAVKNHWNSTLQKKADNLRKIYLAQEDPLAGIDKQMRRHFEMLIKDVQRSDSRKKGKFSSGSDSCSEDDDAPFDDDYDDISVE